MNPYSSPYMTRYSRLNFLFPSSIPRKPKATFGRLQAFRHLQGYMGLRVYGYVGLYGFRVYGYVGLYGV